MPDKTLSVAAIEEGTVVDHIPAGQGLKIIRALHLEGSGLRISLGLNLPSRRMGLKDLIKVEKRFLSDKEACEVAIFAPQATVSTIRQFQVERKVAVHLPPMIRGILTCPNLNCVTRSEPIQTLFHVEEKRRHQIVFRCHYCEMACERGLLS